MENICTTCGKCYAKLGCLIEHKNSVHLGLRYRCPACASLFSIFCCLTNHFKTKHPAVDLCTYCQTNDIFEKSHINNCLKVRPETGESLEKFEDDFTENLYIPEDGWEPDLTGYAESMHQQITNYWRLIKTNKKLDNMLHHTYNYRWGQANGNFFNMVTDIFSYGSEAFRIDAALGCLLKHRETGEFKYWYACYNNFTLLHYPFLVKNGKDIKKLAKILENTDLEENYTRPDTKLGFGSSYKFRILHYLAEKFHCGLQGFFIT